MTVAASPDPRATTAMSAVTLEALLMHPGAFGLTTATRLQRAICRICDGQPLEDLADDPDVLAAIGDVSALPSSMPREIILLAAIRTAKSLLAAAIAVKAAITCDVSSLRDGEIPRVSILSFDKDKAQVVLSHLTGTLMGKPALRWLLIEEPKADSLLLRHPSGRSIEVKVVAGARAGGSLVARWCAGCIFDEAPRMNGEEDGVVNYDESRTAVLGRMLPGAQIVAIGSPWAPRGPIYDMVQEHWRKPTAALVVIRAPARAMNPQYWTPTRIEQLRSTPGSEQAYRTDVLGEFADPESSLLSSVEIERATRKGPDVLPFEPGHSYVAAMDPGTRGNAWTLVVVTRRRRADGRPCHAVALARQWQGSKAAPLDPETVLGDVADLVRPYGIGCVWTDQLAADFVRSIGLRKGLAIEEETVTATRKVEMFESMRMRFADGAMEIPPDTTLRADLLSIRKRVTTNGLAIELPRTADGRHADYAPALAIATSRPLGEAPAPVVEMTAERRMAAIARAQERMWSEQMRQGDEASTRRAPQKDWIEQLEEIAYGSG